MIEKGKNKKIHIRSSFVLLNIVIIGLLTFSGINCRKGDLIGDLIKVIIEADKTIYSMPDTVYFKLTATNASNETIHLFAPDRPVVDVLIFHNDTEIWHWKKGAYPDPWYYDITPNETLTFGDEKEIFWLQLDNDGLQVPRGTYEVIGVLKTEPERNSASITVELK